MSKIPTKYIEKMYNDVMVNGCDKSTTTQHSNYYGTTGVVWSLTNENNIIYLCHYGTVIMKYWINCHSYRLYGGYSATDQTAINSFLFLNGDYDKMRCKRHNDNLTIETL